MHRPLPAMTVQKENFKLKGAGGDRKGKAKIIRVILLRIIK